MRVRDSDKEIGEFFALDVYLAGGWEVWGLAHGVEQVEWMERVEQGAWGGHTSIRNPHSPPQIDGCGKVPTDGICHSLPRK